MLTYYELDFGLNHVVRKWSGTTDRRANLLVQVPGGQLVSSEGFDGPSGVLICCEYHIIYRHMDAPQHRVPIPRPNHPLGDSDRGLLIVAAVMHKLKVFALPFMYLPWYLLKFFRRAPSSCCRARREICTKSQSSTNKRE
jgi:hypothetical protein